MSKADNRECWTEELKRKRLSALDLVPFGNGFLYPEAETKHVKIIGAPSTGKTTAIQRMLAKIAERTCQNAVVIDADGHYTRVFFNRSRGDCIVDLSEERFRGEELVSDAAQVLLTHDQSRKAPGWVFLTYKKERNSGQADSWANRLGAYILSLMDRPQSDSETWLVFDDLDVIGKIPVLVGAMHRFRRFGIRCILSFGSLPRLVDTYGSLGANTLIEACESTLLLRCQAGSNMEFSTSAFAAGLVGKRQVEKKELISSEGPGGFVLSLVIFSWAEKKTYYGTTTSFDHIEDAVFASQIEQLEDFHGYCHSSGSPFWSKCDLLSVEPERVPADVGQ